LYAKAKANPAYRFYALYDKIYRKDVLQWAWNCCCANAAGMAKEVMFEPVGGPIKNRIDDAYRAKSVAAPYLNPMIGTRARSATVNVMPRPLETSSQASTSSAPWLGPNDDRP
jgi:hypothetical protein